MQILKIKLSEDEQQFIYLGLIKRFNEEDNKQIYHFGIGPEITGEAELELYTEHSEPSKYNHETPDHLDSVITHRSVVNFRITFFHDGEEVEVEAWDIEDRIRKYYEI